MSHPLAVSRQVPEAECCTRVRSCTRQRPKQRPCCTPGSRAPDAGHDPTFEIQDIVGGRKTIDSSLTNSRRERRPSRTRRLRTEHRMNRVGTLSTLGK